ncbi:MAG: hypothetical protein PUE63_09525 [Lachnospiraceae bacterium]|nr:hypothetical protein [Lachnospiraceae bacterium]
MADSENGRERAEWGTGRKIRMKTGRRGKGREKQADRTREKKKGMEKKARENSGKGVFSEMGSANRRTEEPKWPENGKAAKSAFRSGWNRNAPVSFLKTEVERFLIPRGRT